jgi:hypothetical protein
MNKLGIVLSILLLGLAVSAAAEEPARVTVQHVLVAFQGSIPEAEVTRTRAEAAAAEGLERAKISSFHSERHDLRARGARPAPGEKRIKEQCLRPHTFYG